MGNMYDIRDLVVKPVIKFVESKRDKCGQYSWVELVAREPQPPYMLVSHYWGGRFRDFMAAVDRVCTTNMLSTKKSMWVCTFANSQFGEEFGTRLVDSPFAQAVHAAAWGTILIVDRDAGSLKRSWCSVELLYTE